MTIFLGHILCSQTNLLCLVLTQSLQLSASARVAYLFFILFWLHGMQMPGGGVTGRPFRSHPALVSASPGAQSCVVRPSRAPRPAHACTFLFILISLCCYVFKLTGLFPTTSSLPLTPRDSCPKHCRCACRSSVSPCYVVGFLNVWNKVASSADSSATVGSG